MASILRKKRKERSGEILRKKSLQCPTTRSLRIKIRRRTIPLKKMILLQSWTKREKRTGITSSRRFTWVRESSL